MIFADMHLHSTHSDGIYAPQELVEVVKQCGYGAAVLTDLNTVSASELFNECARQAGLLSLTGVEITCVEFGKEFHILGMDFHPEETRMQKLLTYLSDKETARTRRLFERGVRAGTLRGILWDEVLAYNFGITCLCNEHVFRAMKAKGLLQDSEYNRFFAENFSPKIEILLPYRLPSAAEVITAINGAGGIAVLGNPHGCGSYVEALVKMGLRGIEVSHYRCSEEETELFVKLAQRFGLYQTGGTDHTEPAGGQQTRYSQNENPYDYPPLSHGVEKEEFLKMYHRLLG